MSDTKQPWMVEHCIETGHCNGNRELSANRGVESMFLILLAFGVIFGYFYTKRLSAFGGIWKRITTVPDDMKPMDLSGET